MKAPGPQEVLKPQSSMASFTCSNHEPSPSVRMEQVDKARPPVTVFRYRTKKRVDFPFLKPCGGIGQKPVKVFDEGRMLHVEMN